jgi:hypothetical protein
MPPPQKGDQPSQGNDVALDVDVQPDNDDVRSQDDYAIAHSLSFHLPQYQPDRSLRTFAVTEV